MDQWTVEQFEAWMDGWLIRMFEEPVPDSVRLNGSIRVAAFDTNDHLCALDCLGECSVRERIRKGYRLYAVDQRTHLLHFALRSLAICKYPTMNENYWLGANGHMQLRMGSASGVSMLMRMSHDTKLSPAQAYCLVQEGFEQEWRNALVKEKKNEVWTSETCFSSMKSMERDMSRIARELFAAHGLIVCGDLVIRGVSSPLFI